MILPACNKFIRGELKLAKQITLRSSDFPKTRQESNIQAIESILRLSVMENFVMPISPDPTLLMTKESFILLASMRSTLGQAELQSPANCISAAPAAQG